MHNLAAQINLANPEIEDGSGHLFPFIKAYFVNGRGGGLRIIVDAKLVKELNETLSDLRSDAKLNAESEKDLRKEITDLEKELEFSAENYENEINSAENALEDFEYKTGFRTSARSLDARIQELADLVVELQGKNEELLIDNKSLACNIKELMAENEKLKSQLGV